jgi:Flp pilus assembly protein TadD
VTAAGLALLAALALPGRVVVMPPQGPSGGAPGWIGAAVEETLPRALRRAGVAAVPSSDRRRVLEALGIGGPLSSRATGVRVAESLDARVLVFGSWDLAGQELALELRALDVTAAALGAPVAARGRLEDLAGLVEGLARELAGPAPAERAPQPPAPAVSFAALRALGEALVAREAEARVRGLRRAMEIEPHYLEAGLALARLLFDAKRFDEARETLARLRTAAPFAREALFLEGACLLGLGRQGPADVLYAQLLAQEPTAAALANRAFARLRLSAGEGGASLLLRQALDRAPYAADLPFALGWSHLVEGDSEAAAFWLREAVRYAPSDAHARLGLSWALRRTARADEADEQWRAAAALDPALEPLRLADGRQRLERILPSETALVLDVARAADARESRAAAARGEALLAAGDTAAAVVELEQATRLEAAAPGPHRLLARACDARGERERALAELRAALHAREDPSLRRELAERLRAAGREADARRLLEAR